METDREEVIDIINELTPYFKSPTFIVLALTSIYSIALMLNHIYYLFTEKDDLEQVLKFVGDSSRKTEEISGYASSRSTPHRRLVLAWISITQKTLETQAALLVEEAKALRWESESRFAALGTIANIAPFIGLFGTVVGVIQAFHAISEKMGAGPSVVAGGLSEALISTAAGLFVAVPAVVAYNFFLKRARRLSIELDHVAVVLIHRTKD